MSAFLGIYALDGFIIFCKDNELLAFIIITHICKFYHASKPKSYFICGWKYNHISREDCIEWSYYSNQIISRSCSDFPGDNNEKK